MSNSKSSDFQQQSAGAGSGHNIDPRTEVVISRQLAGGEQGLLIGSERQSEAGGAHRGDARKKLSEPIDAEEIAAFAPTRRELYQLAKYWQKVCLSEESFLFWSERSGIDELGLIDLALDRIERIAQIIGREAAAAAVEEGTMEFVESQDPRLWKRFLKGQRDAD
jgi:hypothetical protein